MYCLLGTSPDQSSSGFPGTLVANNIVDVIYIALFFSLAGRPPSASPSADSVVAILPTGELVYQLI